MTYYFNIIIFANIRVDIYQKKYFVIQNLYFLNKRFFNELFCLYRIIFM